MRLDKYLKTSRIIKRRSIAKDVTEAGRVTINGKIAKPSSEVKPGDILVLGFGSKQLQVEVLAVKENVPASEAAGLYRVIE